MNALCVRSKAIWGYDPKFLENAASELQVDPAWVHAGNVLVSETSGELSGVSAITVEPDNICDLALFFVDVPFVGQCVGTALFAATLKLARTRHAKIMTILSDPNAEAFYEKMGATRIGTQMTASATGRMLPLLEYRFD